MSAVGLVTCTCWCERTEVAIPVEWVDEGRTLPCDEPGCEPGCPAYIEPDEDEQEVAASNVSTIVEPARPTVTVSGFDPLPDSTPDLRVHASVYPLCLILRVGPGICGCGCEQSVARKSLFKSGHDAKLKGKLSRAAAHGCDVICVDTADEALRRDPIEIARGYGGTWEQKVTDGAARIAATLPQVEEKSA